MKALEEFKEKRRNLKKTDWIEKVLADPDKYFEIVVKFAEEAKKRVGRKND